MYIYMLHIFNVFNVCRRVFWITGKYIMTSYLNGLERMTCYGLASEPLALTVDADNQYLYWMTFDNADNTVSLSQLSYTREQCGTRYLHNIYTCIIRNSYLYCSSLNAVLWLSNFLEAYWSKPSKYNYVLHAVFTLFYNVFICTIYLLIQQA